MLKQDTHNGKKLSHTIVTLYWVTMLVVALGTGLAIYKNWIAQLETTQINLLHNANIGNFLVESALLSANKNLRSTRNQLELEFLKGTPSNQAIHKLLMNAALASDVHNKSYELGLMFYADSSGLVYARSDRYLTGPIDVSNRFYFNDLKSNFKKKTTVGPLLQASTTGQWVFHMAVTVHDSTGKFSGILVQQILAASIVSELSRSTEVDSFENMMISYPGSDASFVYPLPTGVKIKPNLIQRQAQTTVPSIWQDIPFENEKLLGVAKSKLLELTSFVTVSKKRVWVKFLQENTILFFYALLGVLVVSLFFFYLYRMAQQLSIAQVSALHDSLTGLHNRRALDEQLPLLLRDSLREQTPLAVLFIDIDHFRLFNERYGHESGDLALKAVAQTLSSVCKRPLDFICRWGGEEFVALLPNTNALATEKLAQDMLREIRFLKLHVPNQDPSNITVSIGYISRTVKDNILESDFIEAADQAMLVAKKRGRNQSVMAESSSLQRDIKITSGNAVPHEFIPRY